MRAAAHPQTLKGWHVLAMILAFFGLVIGVNVIFAVLAVRTFPGEVVKKSYVQGLNYNETLALRARQADLGWLADAAFAPGPDGPTLELRFSDRQGAPLPPAEITASLRRPASAREDVALAFTPAGPGVYRAALPAIGPGQWLLTGEARIAGERLEVAETLLWRP